MSKIVLTGIKPTGNPHLGNLAGAIKPMIERVDNAEEGDKILLFIPNHHALNGLQDKKLLKEYTYSVVASLIALGLDASKVILFKQSDIHQTFELMNILMNYTPKGLMNRAHAYKASVDQAMLGNNEIASELTEVMLAAADSIKNSKDESVRKEIECSTMLDAHRVLNKCDSNINMGLYTYPILMAADILVYGSNIVPVGKDQMQHIEITRDIAGTFNHLYGDTLVMPEGQIQKDLESIPGLDGRKMSKSYGNTIQLFAEENQLKKAIMRIVTDSKTPEEPKDPEGNTIYELYKLFATKEEVEKLASQFRAGGLGYGDAKGMLFDAANAYLSEPRKRYQELLKNPKELDEILAQGAEQAGYLAEKTMRKVRKRLGF